METTTESDAIAKDRAKLLATVGQIESIRIPDMENAKMKKYSEGFAAMKASFCEDIRNELAKLDEFTGQDENTAILNRIHNGDLKVLEETSRWTIFMFMLGKRIDMKAVSGEMHQALTVLYWDCKHSL